MREITHPSRTLGQRYGGSHLATCVGRLVAPVCLSDGGCGIWEMFGMAPNWFRNVPPKSQKALSSSRGRTRATHRHCHSDCLRLLRHLPPVGQGRDPFMVSLPFGGLGLLFGVCVVVCF